MSDTCIIQMLCMHCHLHVLNIVGAMLLRCCSVSGRRASTDHICCSLLSLTRSFDQWHICFRHLFQMRCMPRHFFQQSTSFDCMLCACLQVFERETNREKNLEKAVKEAKVKARKEAAKTSDSDKDRALDEQDILKVLLHLCIHASS